MYIYHYFKDEPIHLSTECLSEKSPSECSLLKVSKPIDGCDKWPIVYDPIKKTITVMDNKWVKLERDIDEGRVYYGKFNGYYITTRLKKHSGIPIDITNIILE